MLRLVVRRAEGLVRRGSEYKGSCAVIATVCDADGAGDRRRARTSAVPRQRGAGSSAAGHWAWGAAGADGEELVFRDVGGAVCVLECVAPRSAFSREATLGAATLAVRADDARAGTVCAERVALRGCDGGRAGTLEVAWQLVARRVGGLLRNLTAPAAEHAVSSARALMQRHQDASNERALPTGPVAPAFATPGAQPLDAYYEQHCRAQGPAPARAPFRLAAFRRGDTVALPAPERRRVLALYGVYLPDDRDDGNDKGREKQKTPASAAGATATTAGAGAVITDKTPEKESEDEERVLLKGATKRRPQEMPVAMEPGAGLSFGLGDDEAFPVDRAVVQTVTLTNVSARRWVFRVLLAGGRRVEARATPDRGDLRAGAALAVELRVVARATGPFDLRVTLAAWPTREGGPDGEYAGFRVCGTGGLSPHLSLQELALAPAALGPGVFGTRFAGVFRGVAALCDVLPSAEPDDVLRFHAYTTALERLRAPPIATYYGAVRAQPLTLALEPASYGMLADLVARPGNSSSGTDSSNSSSSSSSSGLPPQLRARALTDCARAVAFLHATRLVHGSLDTHCFGVVALDPAGTAVCKLFALVSPVLPPPPALTFYTPPEAVAAVPAPVPAADIYSFGTLVYALVNGVDPATTTLDCNSLHPPSPLVLFVLSPTSSHTTTQPGGRVLPRASGPRSLSATPRSRHSRHAAGHRTRRHARSRPRSCTRSPTSTPRSRRQALSHNNAFLCLFRSFLAFFFPIILCDSFVCLSAFSLSLTAFFHPFPFFFLFRRRLIFRTAQLLCTVPWSLCSLPPPPPPLLFSWCPLFVSHNYWLFWG